MDKNDTETGPDAASMGWNKIMEESWQSLLKPWSGLFQPESEEYGQQDKGRVVDSLQGTVKMWQTMAAAMNQPSAFAHCQEATEMTPEVFLRFSQTCLQSITRLQTQASEWLQKRGASLSAADIQQLDRELIKDLAQTYEKEFSRYLKVPQIGLGRFYQERSLQVVDKYNFFQIALSEFLHILYLPFEKSLKSLQEKMTEMAETGCLDDKVKTYYNLWIKLLEGEYMELFQQPEYADAMGKTLCALNEFVKARQIVVDDALKQSNIPTNTDLDELSKEIYLLKKRLRILEKN